MSKIRINDLARELEVKSKAILDALPEVGVTEKKSHSSSLEDHEAEKVRAKFRAASEAQTASRASRFSRAEADAIKTKIDLSHISKPGDVLKAIISKQQPAAPTAAPARPSAAPPPVDAKSAAITSAPPAARAPAPAPSKTAPPRRFVSPPPPVTPTFTVPAPPQFAPPPAPPAQAVSSGPMASASASPVAVP